MVIPLRSFLSTEDLVHRLLSIESRVKDFYRFWQVHAPHYTDHGKTHCKTLEKNLDELIPDDFKNEIDEYEIFLLLSSVYLHDVGIMCATKVKEEDEKIRESHHERSRQFIIDNMKDVLNGSERYVVGNISFAHRDIVPLSDIVRVKTVRHSTLGNKEVRVRFLAGLLRLADSCDLCHTRTTRDLATVSKLSEEASFHHALHERVSGISFDTKEKTICLDLNIASNKEKSICQKYLVNRLQTSLNSVKDTLIRNSIFYIDVSARFTKAATLTTELVVPKEKKVLQRIVEKEHEIYASRAWALYREKNYKESLKYCKKALKSDSKNSLVWYIKAKDHANLGELEEARKSFDKSVELASEDFYWHASGHFYGEVLLNYKKSFQLLKKAHQQNPNDVVNALNYAEALVTVGKIQEGYNLATRIWTKTTDIVRVFNAWTIRVYSLFLMGDKQKGLEELKNLFCFFKVSPTSLSKESEWTYNKIRKYITESSLSNDVKGLLSALIGLAEGKVSVDDFEKKLN